MGSKVHRMLVNEVVGIVAEDDPKFDPKYGPGTSTRVAWENAQRSENPKRVDIGCSPRCNGNGQFIGRVVESWTDADVTCTTKACRPELYAPKPESGDESEAQAPATETSPAASSDEQASAQADQAPVPTIRTTADVHAIRTTAIGRVHPDCETLCGIGFSVNHVPGESPVTCPACWLYQLGRERGLAGSTFATPQELASTDHARGYDDGQAERAARS